MPWFTGSNCSRCRCRLFGWAATRLVFYVSTTCKTMHSILSNGKPTFSFFSREQQRGVSCVAFTHLWYQRAIKKCTDFKECKCKFNKEPFDKKTKHSLNEIYYAFCRYKGGREFYRYVPRDHPPVQVFPVEGVTVDVSVMYPQKKKNNKITLTQAL